MFTFDGTTYTVTPSPAHGYEVTVTEGPHSLTLVSRDGADLATNGIANATAMVRAGMDRWTADRMAYCFALAGRRVVAMGVA